MVSSGDSFQKVSGELVDLGSRLPFLYHVTCCVEVFYFVRVEKFSSVFLVVACLLAFVSTVLWILPLDVGLDF